MKKLILGFLAVALLFTYADAQKLSKDVKKASKEARAGNFDKAVTLIENALKSPENSSMAQVWAVKGDIFGGMAEADRDEIQVAQTVGKIYEVKYPDAPKIAYDAYTKALKVADGNAADKGYKAAISGLEKLVSNTDFVSRTLYQSKMYDKAFEGFSTILETKETLEAVGEGEKLFKDEKQYLDMVYYAGLAAKANGTPEVALPYYKILVENSYPDPIPYAEVYSSMAEKDPEGALAVLEKGKVAIQDMEDEAFKESALQNFLIAEINYYLKKGDYQALETRLEEAIAKEPNNASMQFALASVYDNLYKSESEAGNTERAKKYYDKAITAYEKTVELKDDHADATYNIGAMVYNQAVALNSELAALENDYSDAATRKYKTIQSEQKRIIQEAITYFERSYEMDKTNMRAVKTLVEVYAVINDSDNRNKYQKILDESK